EDEVGRLGEALEHMRVALKDSLVRQLLARTLTAQEHERRRVARELHDETSQSLAALVMRIRAALADAPEGPLRAKLIDAAALAVRTLDEVHRMIVDLRPSVLDDLGLKSAIVWYAERNLKTRGIAVRCEFADLDERLPPQHETAVFRVVQEAMNNIARHAGAESVLIQAAVKDGALSVEVEDDGEGFDPSAIAATPTDGRGWGLLGMRERVEMLGGTLRIDSAKGRGTHVALTMPLSSSKETPWTASAS
ncbi:MAG: sensor histidine kinase, partial [Myxococcales bacterium]